MSTDRVDLLLANLERVDPPADEFVDDLYQRLLPRVRRARAVDASPVGAFDRALARALPVSAVPRVRRLTLLAAVVALTIVALAIALSGSRTQPEGLVKTSQAVYDDPPPFEMWILHSDGRNQRAFFDGDAAFRLEDLTGPPAQPGSEVVNWYLTTEASRADWFAFTQTGWLMDVPAGAAPLHMLDLNWLPLDRRFLDPPSRANVVCADWREIGGEVVAGRPALHVICDRKPTADGLGEAWIDRESGLLLRTDEALPPSHPTDTLTRTPSVTHLDLRPRLDPGMFTLPTPGGRWAEPLLRSGSPLPKARVITGGSFEPSLAVTLPHDWWAWGEGRATTGFERGGQVGRPETTGVYVVRVDQVVDQPTDTERVIADVTELAAWFATHPWLEASAPRSVTVAGIPALAIDYLQASPSDVGDRCPDHGGTDPVPCWRLLLSEDGPITMDPAGPGRSTAYVLEVQGALVVILATSWGPDFHEDDDEVSALIATLEFVD